MTGFQAIFFIFAFQITISMRTGLVLEGGALRGMFTAGVTDVFMEHGIRFDGMIGVSAGAAFGVNIKSHQIGRAVRYNVRYAHDWHYSGIRTWIQHGDLYNAQFAYHDIPNQYDIFDNETFEKDPTEFYVVCTDVETGKPVYQKCMQGGDRLYEWIRASASMPIAAKVVHLEGKKLLDGGITDSIPLAYFQSIGFEKNVVILTQPKGYMKAKMKIQPLFHLWLHQYPAAVKALARRHVMYNQELRYLAEQEQLGKTLVICPKETLPIARVSHDPEKMQQTYQIGRKAAFQALDKVMDFLNKR